VGLDDLTRLGRRFARGTSGRDNEVQEVFAVRSDLPLDAYVLHPDEVTAVASVPLLDALALFEGRRDAVFGTELARGEGVEEMRHIAVSDFAAGEVDGYAALALQGLLAVVGGGSPQPFELR
jgi:hypothetical protein